MKTKLLSLAVLTAAASMSFASVTLSFNAAFAGGVTQNLATSGGVVSNGLHYGVIIDTSGNGLLGSYDAITLGTDGVLSVSSVATDDLLYFGGLTSDTSGLTEGDFATPGGVGGALSVAGIPFGGATGFGDKFTFVWFDGAGQAGKLDDASFTIPADGSLLDYDAPFVGVDPVRNAGLAYEGTSGVSTGSGITFVPEPSAALLGAFGVLGLLRRRRN